MKMLPAVITMVIVSISTIWSSLMLANGLHDTSPPVIAIGGAIMCTGAAAQILDRRSSQIGGGLLMVSGLLVMVLGFPGADSWIRWMSYLAVLGLLSVGIEAMDTVTAEVPQDAGEPLPVQTAQVIQLDVFRRQ